MKAILVVLALGLIGLGFSIMHSSATNTSPMACLRDCCANVCGNGQWDSDGGFCSGPYATTDACKSCQSNCRAGVQPHIAGEETTTVYANGSETSSNKTGTPGTAGTGNASTTSGTGKTGTASNQGFSLGGLESLWIVLGAILAIIAIAILILGIKR
jgi:hypothetical protein